MYLWPSIFICLHISQYKYMCTYLHDYHLLFKLEMSGWARVEKLLLRCLKTHETLYCICAHSSHLVVYPGWNSEVRDYILTADLNVWLILILSWKLSIPHSVLFFTFVPCPSSKELGVEPMQKFHFLLPCSCPIKHLCWKGVTCPRSPA